VVAASLNRRWSVVSCQKKDQLVGERDFFATCFLVDDNPYNRAVAPQLFGGECVWNKVCRADS
jgi:hypothetical protein